MSSKSIKHHFVPQSLLKQFRINESEDQIYVYDKRTMQHFKSAIVDAGSENHFNTIELNGIKINLEEKEQGKGAVKAGGETGLEGKLFL